MRSSRKFDRSLHVAAWIVGVGRQRRSQNDLEGQCMTYKAYIFARPGGAIILGEAYGGLALGFQIDDENTTLVGGFELAGGNAAHVSDAMDFWFALTDNPLRFMSALLPYGRGTRYDMAKILQVDDPQVEAAQTVIERIKATGRNLRSQDWLKDTVEVLEAFGVKGLPGGARQSGVFGGINAPIVPLVEPWPGMALDVSLYEQPDQFGIRTDPNADANENASDPAADQGQDSLDGPRPQPVISSILVRKGHLAVYSHQGFDGTPIVLELGKVFNVKDVKDAVWPDKTVRSWFASASSFDAAMPKTAYASRQRVDFRKLELDARDALRNIAEYREGAIKEQRSFQEESQKILESMRAAAAEAGVSQQAVYFKEEANYQAAAAVKWLVAAGLIAAGTVALALSSIGWFVKGSTGLSTGERR